MRISNRTFPRALTLVVAVMVLLAVTAVPTFVAPLAAGELQAPAKPSNPTAAASSPLVDINRATAVEIERISGIGKVFAARIVAGRPYANKAQLVTKRVLSQAMYDRIKDQIIAKR